MGKKKVFIISALCLAVGIGAGAAGMRIHYNDKIKFAERNSLLIDIKKTLDDAKSEQKYPDYAEFLMINGYLESYDDYTYFYRDKTELEYALILINNSPCLESCGYSIAVDKLGRLYVDNVAEGSPAGVYGMKAGDLIISVDGVEIADDPAKNAKLLLGDDGSKMSLVLDRNGTRVNIPEFIRKKENKASNGSVNAKMLDNDVLYIDLESFPEEGIVWFKGEVNPLIGSAKSVLLDLRNNPGGSGEAARQIADYFVGEGYFEEHAYDGGGKRYETVADESDIHIPVVVLCNENTASSAEILTAMLKQFGDDVRLVGTNTFGKGVYQEEKMFDGGTLHYTAGTYTVGEWECYHGKGIAPDVTVEMDPGLIGTEKDTQMAKALELLG